MSPQSSEPNQDLLSCPNDIFTLWDHYTIYRRLLDGLLLKTQHFKVWRKSLNHLMVSFYHSFFMQNWLLLISCPDCAREYDSVLLGTDSHYSDLPIYLSRAGNILADLGMGHHHQMCSVTPCHVTSRAALCTCDAWRSPHQGSMSRHDQLFRTQAERET